MILAALDVGHPLVMVMLAMIILLSVIAAGDS